MGACVYQNRYLTGMELSHQTNKKERILPRFQPGGDIVSPDALRRDDKK
jgi:hypothetical protein